MNDTLHLNPRIMRQGLSWAQSWSNGPVLCVVTPESTRFQIVSERRFLASWEWMEETGSDSHFFLIPPFVARTLSGHPAYSITSLRVRVHRTRVAITVRDKNGEYVVQWHWKAADFEAPPFFDLMSDSPSDLLERKTFITMADAIHLAIANLGRLEALEQINRHNLAIAVDFSPGHFKIDGQPITLGHERRYYFDPRLIVRGLEVARGKHIGFAITQTPVTGQSILHMISDRDNWRVECALLSLLPNASTTVISQQVRPLPPER
ncbi:MAG: hypothetical protein JXN59_04335 [Anaerolineae bacterium]|nr:hypothetical protein [Anaerolineae bacterium]